MLLKFVFTFEDDIVIRHRCAKYHVLSTNFSFLISMYAKHGYAVTTLLVSKFRMRVCRSELRFHCVPRKAVLCFLSISKSPSKRATLQISNCSLPLIVVEAGDNQVEKSSHFKFSMYSSRPFRTSRVVVETSSLLLLLPGSLAKYIRYFFMRQP